MRLHLQGSTAHILMYLRGSLGYPIVKRAKILCSLTLAQDVCLIVNERQTKGAPTTIGTPQKSKIRAPLVGKNQLPKFVNTAIFYFSHGKIIIPQLPAIVKVDITYIKK